ncbi:protein BREAST CANCER SUSCEPTIBILITY 1-like protein [Cucumis melo var. makuwa]|uniref:Protein BREAST CANCER SUSCEPTIBILITY 1-like protein n=1 Tax=Cucumis melo var. makuwa TaxID=1194695 RepID=A0A5D3CSZ1_CUCMM|nr:protein BREAST CANCER SUSCEPTIBILITY 1-like protein [Cucumis melo var. makuwa]TYK13319.1 protein BREAST CANCER SUSCEPTIBILITY 1-like protein [Cucumis melo var. makuwa]
MGDPSHLEKMGRELKCPICLSLLNSAVSLGCNHVFCNVCIEKSMKSGSNCPVCKVPYRRREVRPAPHMDNLVSIYKSMEAASGINIFVTQNLSSTKLSDGDKQVEGDGNGSKRLNAETSESTAYVQRTSKKESQKIQKSKRKTSASSPLKPSFPRKKRVQVPQHPLSETPTRPAKLASSCNEVNEPKERTVASEDQGQPVLSPFFWLRERDEEDEKLNQQSDLDQSTESLAMNVPAFSDIKDSLDESPSKPQMDEVCGKPSYDLDLFDSEMFEWTQRACSPELCSSPFKLQVVDVAGTETALLASVPNEEPGNQNPNGIYNKSRGIQDGLVPDVPPPEGNSMKDHTMRAKLTKRGGKKNDVALMKCSKKLAESATGNYSHPATETECSSKKQEHDVIIRFGSLKNGSKRSKKKIHYGTESTDAIKATLESVPAAPINLATPNENFTTKTPAFQEEEKENQFLEKRLKNDRASKTMHFGIDASRATPKNVLTDRVSIGVPDGGRENFETETLVLPEGEKACQLPKNNCTKGRGRKKAHFCNNANKRILEDISAHPISLGTPNNGPENFVIELSAFQEVEKVSQFPEKNSQNGGDRRDQRVVQCRRKSKKQKLDSVDNNLRENPSINQNQHDDCAIPGLTTTLSAIATSTDLKREHKKQEKVSSVCVKTSEYGNITQEKYDGAQANRSQLSEKLWSTNGKNLDSMTKNDCSEKHERLDDEFHCAFCRSSEESEGSGRMVHYFNGKPIDADDIKNSKVIHAHWNCVEWAPNVYFDGDTAINLEAELSRSRRITCGCCGNKGAALGCYEKNCRKSFHVPCAKLMPQCQWDTENFVMLCPLHPDSKLPSQDPGYQERKSSCASNRRSNTKGIAVAREISKNGRFTFRESSKKLVLCCSALTIAEREAVDEFQKLSGVPVLQKWDDSVTHIIASTDENGACKRTLKILMGILKGKWILGIEWIKACIQAMEQIKEERFEITLDVHGSRDGPQLGRLRVLNNQPKLFAGFKFFFTADFAPSYKGYLQQLVTAAGGNILHRKPVSSNNQNNCQVFIIYSLELPDQSNPAEKNNILHRRRSDAALLAKSAAAKVATNLWLLNSIASSKLTSLEE